MKPKAKEYEKHRMYLNNEELAYLHTLLSDNLTGMVRKPEVGNRNTHISILTKLIRQVNKFKDEAR